MVEERVPTCLSHKHCEMMNYYCMDDNGKFSSGLIKKMDHKIRNQTATETNKIETSQTPKEIWGFAPKREQASSR